MSSALSLESRRLRWGTKTWALLTVLPPTTSGTDLGSQEWRNYLFLCYSIYPLDFPTQFDVCNAALCICHALDCNKEGIIATFHKNLYYGVVNLVGKYFNLLYARDYPLIHPGCAVREGNSNPKGSLINNPHVEKYMSEHTGDLLIRNLWQRDKYNIQDMLVVNTDTLSHHNKSPEKCLHTAEKDRKWKYLEACLQKRLHLSPFIIYVDFLLRMEAEAMLKHIVSHLAKNKKRPYYSMCDYINNKVAILLARATHRCIQCSRVPAHKISVQLPWLVEGSSLHLFR